MSAFTSPIVKAHIPPRAYRNERSGNEKEGLAQRQIEKKEGERRT